MIRAAWSEATLRGSRDPAVPVLFLRESFASRSGYDCNLRSVVLVNISPPPWRLIKAMIKPVARPKGPVPAVDANRAEPTEIWKARRLIAELSHDQLSLTFVAIQVHTSANYFSEKFKRVTGVNFVRYVAEVRTRKAKELLAHSDSRISEIAFAVGFQSLSQFNRVFKSLTQQSPSQFRGGQLPARQSVRRGKKTVRKVIGKNA